jgi:hypothetical protein
MRLPSRSITSMTFWFVRAFQLVRKIEGINRPSLVALEIPSRSSKGNPKGCSPMNSVSSPSDNSSQSNTRGVTENQSIRYLMFEIKDALSKQLVCRASVRVMMQGLLLVGTFYMGWALIALNGTSLVVYRVLYTNIELQPWWSISV